jgi:hypothetical protein
MGSYKAKCEKCGRFTDRKSMTFRNGKFNCKDETLCQDAFREKIKRDGEQNVNRR